MSGLHHYVLKPGSITTKFRVVFDAFATRNSAVELLRAGFKFRHYLFAIFMCFRKQRFDFMIGHRENISLDRSLRTQSKLQLIW